MLCPYEVGDVVYGVPDEQSLCPNAHPEGEGWENSSELLGKLRRVEQVYVGGDGCVMLELEGEEMDWCWGTFRKLEPSTKSVAELIRDHSKVPA